MTDLIPRPTDDYDVAGWQAYYAANPHELRAVGADAAPDDGGDGGEGGEGGGDGGTRTGESLIDLDAGGDDPDAGKGGEGEGNGAETAEVEVGDSKVSVPKAVADELTELRTKAAEAGESRAPEGDYELVVPEDLAKDGIAADTEDPLFKPIAELAREKNWSQDDLNDITAIYYRGKAAEAKADADASGEERQKLIDHYSDGGRLSEDDALKKASENGKWVTSLLSSEIKKHPEFMDELKVLTMTAAGCQLLEAIRNRVGETATPGGEGGKGADPDPLGAMYPSMN